MAKKTKPATEPVADELITKPTSLDASTEKTKGTKMSEINVMELEQDLDQYEDYEILPARNYPAEIRKVDEQLYDSGAEGYKISFRIDPESYPVDYDRENAPEGTTFIYQRIFKIDPKDRRSITAMKKWYKTMGLSLKTSVIDHTLWEGVKVTLNIGHGTWNGEKRAEIKGIEALAD